VWKAVTATSSYTVNTDDWSDVSFAPIKAKRIRIKVKLNEKFAAGIHEVTIE
jgi:hypothetical protein